MKEILGFSLDKWVSQTHTAFPAKVSKGITGNLFVFGKKCSRQQKKKYLAHRVSGWQEKWLDASSQVQHLTDSEGPMWFLDLKEDNYSEARTLFGEVQRQFSNYPLENIAIHLCEVGEDTLLGGLIGLEMSRYRFIENRGKKSKVLPQLFIQQTSKKKILPKKLKSIIEKASSWGSATNLARHLVNLPGEELNPKNYVEALKKLFRNSKSVKVDVWTPQKLEKEKMGLILGVGRAGTEGPYIVRLRYRPARKKAGGPIAFVGKGITFDSGGLDIKPSVGMRLMKKDMGGSATVVGLCYGMEQIKSPTPCDFYLAIAENAVDQKSFRPGDILTARNGKTVEVHNTDAEGRLVLADALSLATSEKGANKPKVVVDVATLTGAARIALGMEIGGLFSNDTRQAQKLQKLSFEMGDPLWQMPLYQPYLPKLKTGFADLLNCSDGFGGSITAALFLQEFVNGLPWMHLDVYAWKERTVGPWSEVGGSGQAVQALLQWIESQ